MSEKIVEQPESAFESSIKRGNLPNLQIIGNELSIDGVPFPIEGADVTSAQISIAPDHATAVIGVVPGPGVLLRRKEDGGYEQVSYPEGKVTRYEKNLAKYSDLMDAVEMPNDSFEVYYNGQKVDEIKGRPYTTNSPKEGYVTMLATREQPGGTYQEEKFYQRDNPTENAVSVVGRTGMTGGNGKDIQINGQRWSTLQSASPSSINRAISDSDGKRVMVTTSNNGGEIIVDNEIWNGVEINGFGEHGFAGKYAYVVTSNSLYVNKEKWLVPAMGDKTKVASASINESGQVAALVDLKINGQFTMHAGSVGLGGERSWDNELLFVSTNQTGDPKAFIDKNGTTAAVGVEFVSNKVIVAIEGVSFKLDPQPAKIPKVTFENGVMTLNYLTLGGEEIEQKLSLKNGAQELAERNEQYEQQQKMIQDIYLQIRQAQAMDKLPEILAALGGGQVQEEIKTELESSELELELQKVKDNLGIAEKLKAEAQQAKVQAESALDAANSRAEEAEKEITGLIDGLKAIYENPSTGMGAGRKMKERVGGLIKEHTS